MTMPLEMSRGMLTDLVIHAQGSVLSLSHLLRIASIRRLFHWVAGPACLLGGIYFQWGLQGAVLGIGQALAAIIMVIAQCTVEAAPVSPHSLSTPF